MPRGLTTAGDLVLVNVLGKEKFDPSRSSGCRLRGWWRGHSGVGFATNCHHDCYRPPVRYMMRGCLTHASGGGEWNPVSSLTWGAHPKYAAAAESHSIHVGSTDATAVAPDYMLRWLPLVDSEVLSTPNTMADDPTCNASSLRRSTRGGHLPRHVTAAIIALGIGTIRHTLIPIVETCHPLVVIDARRSALESNALVHSQVDNLWNDSGL